MGLDMYLEKEVYVGAEYKHRAVSGEINIRVGDEPLPVNFERVSTITERAGYWRKANAIHRWFVENVQDGEDNCGRYYVTVEDAQKLLDAVNAVLADNSKAAELLPTASGFFFGGTEYDEYYFNDLQSTKEIMEQVVADPRSDYYYHSSW